LKNNFSVHPIKKLNFHPPYIREIQKQDTIVKSGLKELDKFIGGFKSGEINFIDGDNKLASNISNQICVNTYRTYRKNVIYIDGGMSFDPYKIAKYARKMEIDQRAILGHIYISRAFTLFQLTTLLKDKLEQKIIECSPKTLIIEKFLTLYLDSNISSNEANILMKNNLRKIKELTKKYELVTIISNHDMGIKLRKNVNIILYENTDQIVTIKQIGKVINFNFVKKNKRIAISILERGQLHLNDFEMTI
jgi:predicted ATP-dependent serine protease